ncbi:hypothetical protein NDU88_003947 [Pleurodeles waltl]|uniref:Uncharacterized protein n=1 Tax=Pleurodeles waltl TaxID=8319 RepID=A0AAV7LID1_PLEWA|nr:hypothetical protein NDU88_003947 [Pleurodeles waltl]
MLHCGTLHCTRDRAEGPCRGSGQAPGDTTPFIPPSSGRAGQRLFGEKRQPAETSSQSRAQQDRPLQLPSKGQKSWICPFCMRAQITVPLRVAQVRLYSMRGLSQFLSLP